MKLVSNSVVKIDTGFFWQNVKDHWGLTKPSVFSHEKSSYGVIWSKKIVLKISELDCKVDNKLINERGKSDQSAL
jgi:hypothetical protein